MSQQTISKEAKTYIELLKIEEVQFRYTKEDLAVASCWGHLIGNNPNYDKYKDRSKNLRETRERRETESYRNRDYFIVGLEDLLKNPTIGSSLKIWNTLSEWRKPFLFAVYIPNDTFDKKFEAPNKRYDSRIAHLIKKYKWIPDDEEHFHNPSEPDFYLENIHKDFEINNNDYGWLGDIGLMSEKRGKELRKRKEEAAKTLGFTMEEVEFFTKYKEIKELESKKL